MQRGKADRRTLLVTGEKRVGTLKFSNSHLTYLSVVFGLLGTMQLTTFKLKSTILYFFNFFYL